MVTWVQLDCKFAVGLLDFKLGRRGGHAQGVVVSGFDHHLYERIASRGGVGKSVG